MKDDFCYEDEALTTRSDQFNGELIHKEGLKQAIRNVVSACAELDRYKKTLFYAKPNPDLAPLNPADDASNLITAVNGTKTHEYLLHGLVGAATEAGEGLELLLKVLDGEQELDAAALLNLKEEVGDGLWYFAILADVGKFTLDQAQRSNIAKLRKRYPDKFNSKAAITRDLFAEQEALRDAN